MSDTQEIDLSSASNDELKAMGLPPAFTLDDLKTFMTEEEIEAELASDDPLVKVDPSTASKASDADEDDEDDEADEKAEGDADDTAADTEEDKPATAPAAPIPDPVIRTFDNAPHQAIIDGFKAESRGLMEKWQDGDLTDTEYEDQIAALNDKVSDAKIAIKENERERKADEKAVLAAWHSKIEPLPKLKPELYDTADVPALNGSVGELFNEACIHVNTQPQFAHMSLDQRLALAEQMTREIYQQKTGQSLPTNAKAAKAAAAQKPAQPTPAERVAAQGKRPDPVRTLGGVTAASETDVENSVFAAVDHASGLDAERAYASMTQAQKEAYLRGA